MPLVKEVAEKENKYICRIHEVKPKVCREYPQTEKHAKETGCKGEWSQGDD